MLVFVTPVVPGVLKSCIHTKVIELPHQGCYTVVVIEVEVVLIPVLVIVVM